MMNHLIGCRLLAGLMLMTVAINLMSAAPWMFTLFPMMAFLASHEPHAATTLFTITASLVLLSCLMSGVSGLGLFLTKRWGLWCAYPAIMLSTLALFIKYIPTLHLFPNDLVGFNTILSNVAILALTVYLHVLSRQQNQTINSNPQP